MIVAHLIGGNEIEGISNGVVIINGKKLDSSYEDLVSVCGNIELGDLNTSITIHRSSEDVQRDYFKLVQDFDNELGEEFVINNHLTAEVRCSTYEVNFEDKTLTLIIDTYE
ncbi:hypothetical protein CJ467_20345 [Bacillus velezensis]|uniref:hypothetical protein n=1 Tax=Bacillus amyloliquefaciens group TaxID=1938374 RepID=UPI000BA74696|nr:MULTISPECIES: hypothetical protein [Bacillus amyloliquefaciens group]MCA1214729.1 hypothetical protein [Bacillus amyloliquefaciens]PAK28536.1 hypothetical protein CJ467_20345 [Bacillus velezensis]